MNFGNFFKNLFHKAAPAQNNQVTQTPVVVTPVAVTPVGPAPVTAPIIAPVVSAPVPAPTAVVPPYQAAWAWNSAGNTFQNYQAWLDAKMPATDTLGNPCGAPVREPNDPSINTTVTFAGKTLAAVQAEIDAWINGHVPAVTSYGQWRGRKLSIMTDPKGIDVSSIVKNFNAMIDAGMTTTWYIPYIMEAAPTLLAFAPEYGRPLWASLYNCFCGTGGRDQRAQLELAPDEGQPGGVKIQGGKFIITAGGKDNVYDLPFGGLSVHNGYPEVL